MNIEQARKHIGQLVMSYDAGYKLVQKVSKAHGPYRLVKINKAGMAILEGREDCRIPPSILDVYEGDLVVQQQNKNE